MLHQQLNSSPLLPTCSATTSMPAVDNIAHDDMLGAGDALSSRRKTISHMPRLITTHHPGGCAGKKASPLFQTQVVGDKSTRKQTMFETEDDDEEDAFYLSLLHGEAPVCELNDNSQCPENTPEVIARVRKGVPDYLRGRMWQYLARCGNGITAASPHAAQFQSSLSLASPFEKLILRDLHRTFPNVSAFKAGSRGRESMFRLTKAYSNYDKDVGYCQGLAFIAGPLVLNADDAKAFALLVRLLGAYGLRSHYTQTMEGLHVLLSRFDCFMHEKLPKVFNHLLNEEVHCSMYATQWFMTLFAYRLPLPCVYRIMDLIFAEGISVLYKAAIAVMKRGESRLLGLKFEKLLEYLKEGIFADFENDPELLVREIIKIEFEEIPVHSRSLMIRQNSVFLSPAASASTSFSSSAARSEAIAAAEQAQRALAEAKDTIKDREDQILRLSNHNAFLEAQVKKLQIQLSDTNTEHVQLANELVQMRVKFELASAANYSTESLDQNSDKSTDCTKEDGPRRPTSLADSLASLQMSQSSDLNQGSRILVSPGDSLTTATTSSSGVPGEPQKDTDNRNSRDSGSSSSDVTDSNGLNFSSKNRNSNSGTWSSMTNSRLGRTRAFFTQTSTAAPSTSSKITSFFRSKIAQSNTANTAVGSDMVRSSTTGVSRWSPTPHDNATASSEKPSSSHASTFPSKKDDSEIKAVREMNEMLSMQLLEMHAEVQEMRKKISIFEESSNNDDDAETQTTPKEAASVN